MNAINEPEVEKMNYTSLVVVITTVLAVLLMAGCTSTPENGTSNMNNSTSDENEPTADVRYVELNFADGTKAGGKYISESEAFVTIVPMYVIGPDGNMAAGSGKEVGMKTSLITSMVNIEDPTSYVATTLKAQEEKAAELAAIEKKKAEEWAKLSPAEARKAMTTKSDN